MLVKTFHERTKYRIKIKMYSSFDFFSSFVHLLHTNMFCGGNYYQTFQTGTMHWIAFIPLGSKCNLDICTNIFVDSNDAHVSVYIGRVFWSALAEIIVWIKRSHVTWSIWKLPSVNQLDNIS